MIKKLFIAISALIALIAVVVIAAGMIVYTKVNKEFIAAHMAKALNRQVYIEKINTSIFSVISGIEVKNVSISNFKNTPERERIQGRPVAANDVFAGIESLQFKVKLMPLLRKQVELKELVLYAPVINLTRNKQGVLNIDDLMKSPEKKDDMDKNKPAEPVSADMIPVAIAIGEIGMKNGTINFYDGEHDQKFQVYKLTTLARDISIDPKDLAHKDEIKIKFVMGIRTVGAMKTGSVESFDFTVDAAGKIIPFDVTTRLLNPEAIIHLSVPDGEISGLQVFNSIATIPILGDYLGEYIAFLKEKQQWKDSKETGLDLYYKNDKAKITNGNIHLKQAKIAFDGTTDIKTSAIDMNVGMVLNKEINEPVQVSLAKRIDSLIKNPEIKKYANPTKLAEAAMQPLLNQDGLIDLQTKVEGTTKKPDVKLTRPRLDTLGAVVQNAAGSVVVEAGKAAVKENVKKVLTEDQQKVLEGVGGLFTQPKKK